MGLYICQINQITNLTYRQEQINYTLWLKKMKIKWTCNPAECNEFAEDQLLCFGDRAVDWRRKPEECHQHALQHSRNHPGTRKTLGGPDVKRQAFLKFLSRSLGWSPDLCPPSPCTSPSQQVTWFLHHCRRPHPHSNPGKAQELKTHGSNSKACLVHISNMLASSSESKVLEPGTTWIHLSSDTTWLLSSEKLLNIPLFWAHYLEKVNTTYLIWLKWRLNQPLLHKLAWLIENVRLSFATSVTVNIITNFIIIIIIISELDI